ncbi:zinc finger MYM-type protein 1-like [Ctenocephalides felis]|uniref:zinc finger MYM-type protein 1-like n=1 Tax=Ctenocephalides felis TaxID=7515 RepID=UPI000E6E1302|nr:zinc finger MYM-type protein 1-like [Ctenocephalides felis]
MSGYRKKLSGAEYRKRKTEESLKQECLLNKIPKISNFMRTVTSSKKIVSDDQQALGSSVPELNDTSAQNTEAQPKPSLLEDTNSSKTTNFFLSKDAIENLLATETFWKFRFNCFWNLNDETRDYITRNGIPTNNVTDFKNSRNVYNDKTRFCSESLFKRTLKNEEIQRRESGEVNAFTGDGFRDWKNSKARIEAHENSDFHKTNISHFKARAVIQGRVDQHLMKQLDNEILYWKKVLYRVIAIVKSLAIRGLPFRGHSERIGDQHNGNFLGSVELLAEFDPFLQEHLKLYAHPGRGNTSYLSKTIYEEIISLVQSKVLKHITKEVQSAKYFGVIVDSTPDIAHVDQLTIIIRYVRNNGEIVERFLEFIPNTGHKAQDIEDALLKSLERNGLDIMNCRGQSYDNASNMSGVYSGVQSRIKATNPLAEYVPCAAHSLNLVGTCAAESVTEAVDFFSTLQELYNFFTISTNRWDILVQHTSLRLKSLSQTRWSARHDACYALEKEWSGTIIALKFIAENNNEKPTTRCQARGLLQKLQHLETAILVVVWNAILERFNAASKKFQDSKSNLSSVSQMYSSLALFLEDMRAKQFSEYEEKAKALSGVKNYHHDNHRKRTRKFQADESQEHERVFLCGEEHFRINIYYRILDTLSVQLAGRKSAYHTLYEKFNIFDNLSEIETRELKIRANELVTKYPEDLEDTLGNECIHLQQLLIESFSSKEDVRTAQGIYNFLHSNNLREVYPNIDIALRIFLSIPVTNCSGERSFSTLKRVKTYLRASMGQDRLSALALLTIEAQLVQEIDYNDIVDVFAQTKSRKKYLRIAINHSFRKMAADFIGPRAADSLNPPLTVA